MMKRLLFAIGIVLAFATLAVSYQISAISVFSSQATVASATSTSSAVDLRNVVNTGNFALHYTIAGSGTASLSFSTSSTSGGTFVTYATAIATGKTAGTYYSPFSPPVSPWMKILVTETGGAQSITTTARLVVQ
jgi:hypothetical protein